MTCKYLLFFYYSLKISYVFDLIGGTEEIKPAKYDSVQDALTSQFGDSIITKEVEEKGIIFF